MQQSDLIIIGGGIVGLATAYRFLERFPGKRVTVLEKEADDCPASNRPQLGRAAHRHLLSARLAQGAELPRGQAGHGRVLPPRADSLHLCGKIIVAVDESELPRMETLLERGKANGVVCERIGPERIRELEPHAAGLAAIHIPEAGVVDYAQVARRLAEMIEAQGSAIVTGAKATGIRRDTSRAIVETTAGEFAAEQVVNCAGLYSDRVTRLSGVRPSAMIVPFRGEFYELRPEAHHLVRMLIYPGARSELPVPRRALHAPHRRPRRMRAERRAGLCPRRLSQHDRQPPRPGGDALLPRLLAAGRPLLADRRRRNVAQLQQARRSCGRCSGSCRRSNRGISIGPRPACGRRPSAATARCSTTS